jgi:hypothetical protein
VRSTDTLMITRINGVFTKGREEVLYGKNESATTPRQQPAPRATRRGLLAVTQSFYVRSPKLHQMQAYRSETGRFHFGVSYPARLLPARSIEREYREWNHLRSSPTNERENEVTRVALLWWEDCRVNVKTIGHVQPDRLIMKGGKGGYIYQPSTTSLAFHRASHLIPPLAPLILPTLNTQHAIMGSAASKPATPVPTYTAPPVKYDEKRSAVSQVQVYRQVEDDRSASATTEMGLTRSKLDAWQQEFDAVSLIITSRLAGFVNSTRLTLVSPFLWSGPRLPRSSSPN